MNETFSWYHPILEALGYTIFHSLWQSVLLFFPLQLVLLFCKRPVQRYRLLYGTFALLFLVFLVTFLAEWNDAVVWQHQQKLLAARPGNGALTMGAYHFDWNRSGPWWQYLTRFYHTSRFRQVLAVLSIGYVTGILFLGLRTMLAFRNVRLLRKQLIAAPEALQQRISFLAGAIGIRKKIGLFLSSHIDVPMMLGHLKPVVVLPLALLSRLDVQQTEAILLHELAHIRRMDYLFNILQTVMEIILFFNPVTWWFSGIIRRERELCCDDVTVGHTAHPVKYAEALLQLELSRNMPAPALAATGDNKKYSLLNRIKRIVEMKTSHKRSPQSMLAALASLLFVAALCCYYTAAAQDKKKNSTTSTTTTTTYTREETQHAAEPPAPPEPAAAAVAPGVPETPLSDDENEMVDNALQQAHTALQHINWNNVSNSVQEAHAALRELDTRELDRSMKEADKELRRAQKELDGADLAMVNNSLGIAADALQSIDWDAVGNSIDLSLQSLKTIDKEAMEKTMNEVRQAMQEAKSETLKAQKLTRSQMDSLKFATRTMVRRMQDNNTIVIEKRKQVMDQARQQQQAAQDQARAQRDIARQQASRQRMAAMAQAQQARVQAAGDRKPEQLLKALEQKGLIDRNEKFKVSYKNNELKVNGQVIPAADYKNYLPQGDKASLHIAGSKGNLSIDMQQ